jgi:hypothetical protein
MHVKRSHLDDDVKMRWTLPILRARAPRHVNLNRRNTFNLTTQITTTVVTARITSSYIDIATNFSKGIEAIQHGTSTYSWLIIAFNVASGLRRRG